MEGIKPGEIPQPLGIEALEFRFVEASAVLLILLNPWDLVKSVALFQLLSEVSSLMFTQS